MFFKKKKEEQIDRITDACISRIEKMRKEQPEPEPKKEETKEQPKPEPEPKKEETKEQPKPEPEPKKEEYKQNDDIIIVEDVDGNTIIIDNSHDSDKVKEEKKFEMVVVPPLQKTKTIEEYFKEYIQRANSLKYDLNELLKVEIERKQNTLDKVHPIYFGTVIPKEKQGEGISDKLFQRLEKAFSNIIPKETNYAYMCKRNKFISLVYESNYVNKVITIDPGILIGEGQLCAEVPAINNKGEKDKIFVNIELFPEIIKNLFTKDDYIIDKNDAQKVMNSTMFSNIDLYIFIDMNNTEFMTNLKRKEFLKLGKKLTFIVNFLKNHLGYEITPRFRFKEFKSINDFVLSSDNEVISPLIETGETSPIILSDAIFKVTNDDVRFMQNGVEITNLHIDKYGAM